MTETLTLSLACWRLTYMLVYEDGPWDIFEKLRLEAIGYRFSPLFCFNCTSIWVSAFLCLIFKQDFILIFVISAVSILFNTIVEAHQE